MPQPLLNSGEQEYVADKDETISTLRAILRDREHTIDLCNSEITLLKRANSDGLMRLKRALQPLYDALRVIWGELDTVSVDSTPAVSSQASSVWDDYKRNMPGLPSKLIDALLTHREMTVPRLKVVMHCSKQTVYNTISRLNSAGLITKNGGKYALKQI